MKSSMETSTQQTKTLQDLPQRQAKTFIYALVYGAGDAKIGSIVGAEMLKEDDYEIDSTQTQLKDLVRHVKSAASRGF